MRRNFDFTGEAISRRFQPLRVFARHDSLALRSTSSPRYKGYQTSPIRSPRSRYLRPTRSVATSISFQHSQLDVSRPSVVSSFPPYPSVGPARCHVTGVFERRRLAQPGFVSSRRLVVRLHTLLFHSLNSTFLHTLCLCDFRLNRPSFVSSLRHLRSRTSPIRSC